MKNTNSQTPSNIPNNNKEKLNCKTAGQGFAKTENTKIAPENCGHANTRGFATVDYSEASED